MSSESSTSRATGFPFSGGTPGAVAVGATVVEDDVTPSATRSVAAAVGTGGAGGWSLCRCGGGGTGGLQRHWYIHVTTG